MIGTARYPALETLTHGWRWYRIDDGKLLSPLAPFRVELPRSGLLPNAYFIPGQNVDQILSTAAMITAQRWYDLAVTYGTVTGPFVRDPDMPRIGSMQCGSYEAHAIFTNHPKRIADHYDIPISPLNRSVLLAAMR